jgi:hypothetical protein
LPAAANPASAQAGQTTSTTGTSASVNPAVASPAFLSGEQIFPAGAPVQQIQFPVIQLDDVTWDWLNPTALINGKIVYVGDNVDGAELIEITPISATLRFEGASQTFHLP